MGTAVAEKYQGISDIQTSCHRIEYQQDYFMREGRAWRTVGAGNVRVAEDRESRLQTKLLDGNPSKRRPVVVDLPTENGDNIPRKCPELLAEFAFYSHEPSIESVYEQTVKWLEGTKCLHLINPELITEYAILKTRWYEIEWMVAKKPLFQHHGMIVPNPMISESIKYLKAYNESWDRIWAIVSQNSSTYYGDKPKDDIMRNLIFSKLQ